jgi:uncharacterized delta-60 repeat protein
MLIPCTSQLNRGRRLAQRRRFRPQLELLEDRCLLSAGALDPTFGQYGTITAEANASAVAVVVEGDGKIVLLDQTPSGYDVLRFNSDGSLDTTFGNHGEITGAFGAGAVMLDLGVLPNDQIVIGGEHTSGGQAYLDVARFNSDGSPDTAFGNGGLAEFTPGGAGAAIQFLTTGMAAESNGEVFVAGTFGNAVAVVHLNADGSQDASFGGSGMATTTLGAGAQAGELTLQTDGKIVMTGGDGNQLDVVRFNVDGSPDATFGAGGIETATLSGTAFEGSRVAIDSSSGQVVVAANSYTPHSTNFFPLYGTGYTDLFRVNVDGTLDTGFGTAGQIRSSAYEDGFTPPPETHSGLAVDHDGKVLLASFRWGNSVVTRYNVDGTVDLTYGIGGSTYITSPPWWNGDSSTALALQADGKLVFAGTSGQWVNGDSQSNTILVRLQADSSLAPSQFGSDTAFRQYLISQAVQQYSYLFGTVRYPYYYWGGPLLLALSGRVLAAAAVDAATPAATATSDAAGYSQTNTQVAGVDEGDTVKTDGQYLYIISNGKLVIINASPGSNLATVSATTLSGNAITEYLNGDRLTVISQSYEQCANSFEGDGGNVPAWWYAPVRSHPQVTITVYDVSNPAAPAVVQTTTLDGYYDNSRAIGNTVYVAVTNNLSSLPSPTYSWNGSGFVYESAAAYIAQLEALPLNNLLPQYSMTWTDANGTHSSSGPLNSAADIYEPAVSGDNNLMSLVAVDTGNVVPAGPQSVSFLTSYDATLYAAPDNFYLITSRWSYAGDWTFIDKLSLQNGGISLAATGAVPGNLVNRFSVNEDGAYLDIATSSTGEENRDGSNNLYVLAQDNQTLKVVGKVLNLAPGEMITAVQFVGNAAFISTSLYRDPIFAIDLSNPADPVLAGKLEVPGVTNYLLPAGATHLIGVGEQPDPVTGHGEELTISLYDVSNLNNPTLLSSYVVSSEFSCSLANFDSHAITYFAADGALALPFSASGTVCTPSGAEWVWQDGLLVFHVDTTSGTLNVRGEISDASPISRSVFIGNMVYVISDTSVQMESLDSIGTQIAQTFLPPPNWYWWVWQPPAIILPILPIYVPITLPLPPITITPVTITTGTTTTGTTGGDQGSTTTPSTPASSPTVVEPTVVHAVFEQPPANPPAGTQSDVRSLATAVGVSSSASPVAATIASAAAPAEAPASTPASISPATTPLPTTAQESPATLTRTSSRQRRTAIGPDTLEGADLTLVAEAEWVRSTGSGSV